MTPYRMPPDVMDSSFMAAPLTGTSPRSQRLSGALLAAANTLPPGSDTGTPLMSARLVPPQRRFRGADRDGESRVGENGTRQIGACQRPRERDPATSFGAPAPPKSGPDGGAG